MKLPRPVTPNFPISSPYGQRIDPVTKKKSEFHYGIDFAVPIGTPIYACEDGIVERIGYEDPIDPKKGFGFRVWQTFMGENNVRYGIVYGHLSKSDLLDKRSISKGDLVGLSGNSGRSTGPHLHIGCREWNTSAWVEIEVDNEPAIR